jgi:hypothetical protein
MHYVTLRALATERRCIAGRRRWLAVGEGPAGAKPQSTYPPTSRRPTNAKTLYKFRKLLHKIQKTFTDLASGGRTLGGMPLKVDFDVVLMQDATLAVDSVRPGQQLVVALDAESGQLQCSTADGLVLGTVPAAAARQLHGGIHVTVRSVKKDPVTPDRLAAVQARAVAAEAAGAANRVHKASCVGARRRTAALRQVPMP